MNVLIFKVAVAFAIAFVFVALASGFLYLADKPSTAHEIKEFIGSSPCRLKTVEERLSANEKITKSQMADIARTCDVIDAQMKAVRP